MRSAILSAAIARPRHGHHSLETRLRSPAMAIADSTIAITGSLAWPSRRIRESSRRTGVRDQNLFARIVWSCRIVLDDDDRRSTRVARYACWLTEKACPRTIRLGQRHDPGYPQSQYTKRDEGDQPDLQRTFRPARPFEPTLLPIPAVPHRRRLVLVYGRPPHA